MIALRLAGALVMTAICGCGVLHNNVSNVPMTPATPHDMGAPADLAREHSIVISFSGGGLRASAFALGVLEALQDEKTPDGDLLGDVRSISSVSGSSLTAAYYGLYGREGLQRFRRDVLLPGLESGLRLTLGPLNITRLVRGALNMRADFGDSLDARVFQGATFADLYRSSPVEVRIMATDLYHRVPFPFLPSVFRALCSDLSRYAVADAVAASMAVPLVFAPTVLRTYPDDCPSAPSEIGLVMSAAERSHSVRALARLVETVRDPEPRYLKLADGGLTDNFALSTLTLSRLVYGTPHAPLTPREAVRIRRLLLISVNASRGPGGDWLQSERGPGGIDLALAAIDASIDTAANFAADAFDATIREWERSVIEFRCGLSAEEAAGLGAPPGWDCRDVRFLVGHVAVSELEPDLRRTIEAIPTRLALPQEQIDAAIEGGRAGTAALRPLRDYLRSARRRNGRSDELCHPTVPRPSFKRGGVSSRGCVGRLFEIGGRLHHGRSSCFLHIVACARYDSAGRVHRLPVE